jgi:sulfur carrier protein ThiS
MLSGHATFVHSQSEKTTTPVGDLRDAERLFLLFREKVRNCELLSASTMQLLQALGFTGRLTVILHNGLVVKSGYEEGYFRRKDDMRI